MAATVILGVVGALVFQHFNLPLPWMLGPMVACLLAAMVRAPIKPLPRVLPPMRAVIGVMLGASFTPDLIDRAGQFAASLVFVAPYVALAGLIGVPYFRRVAGYDLPTAYFASMPGGLVDMTMIGHALGGDVRKIVLAHASRIMFLVLVFPFWFQWSEGVSFAQRPAIGVPILESVPSELAVLAACAAIGWPLGRLLRLPAAPMLGSLIVSAAAHITGLSQTRPPTELVNLALLLIGIGLGCRFAGTPPREMALSMAHATGLLVILLGTTFAFAYGLSELLGIRFAAAVLAFSPGGQTEMSLIALTLGIDVAYISLHHVVRAFSVILAAPLVYRLFRAKS